MVGTVQQAADKPAHAQLALRLCAVHPCMSSSMRPLYAVEHAGPVAVLLGPSGSVDDIKSGKLPQYDPALSGVGAFTSFGQGSAIHAASCTVWAASVPSYVLSMLRLPGGCSQMLTRNPFALSCDVERVHRCQCCQHPRRQQPRQPSGMPLAQRPELWCRTAFA